MSNHSAEYISYMKSDEWRELCRSIYEKRGRICERCGAAGVSLQVHHLTYDRLGRELEEDLQIVCAQGCHQQADKEREQHEVNRRFQKRADAWAAKVYGDDWRDRVSPDRVIDEFYDWLKDKEHRESEWITM